VTKENVLSENLKDEVARGAVVTHNGELLWPNPNPPKLDAVKAKKAVEVKKEDVPRNVFKETMKSSALMASAIASIIGFGVLCPDPAFMTMFSTFSLAVIAGY
jgi:NAD(P) transhydrogenase